MKRIVWIWLAALLLAPWAWAAEVQPRQTVDPDRLYRLTSELRCLVCQNESLADSSAPLAIDLKNEIRNRMARGESDADIKKFLVDRYGNFVIYRPPFDARTLLLWLGPLLLAAIGLLALWRTLLAAKTNDAGSDAGGAPENAKNGQEEPTA
jgi:cytochrome c-type biogenesis protein CcmH